MESLFEQIGQLAAVVSNIVARSGFAGLSDGELQDALRNIARGRHQFDLLASLASGEIARRSERAPGFHGLARSAGFANPQSLVQSLTGTTRAEAVRLVNVGSMIAEAQDAGAGSMQSGTASASGDAAVGGDPSAGDEGLDGSAHGAGGAPHDEPWHAVITRAVTSERLSTAQADALRAGLGDPTEGFGVDALRAAAEELIPALSGVTPERVWRVARDARDLLDVAGVSERREQQRARRSLKAWKDREGMVHLSAVFDAEDGEEVLGAINHVLGPRIGGPRFVDPAGKAQACPATGPASDHVADPAADPAADAAADPAVDERSTEQLAADTLVDLVRTALASDPNKLGRARPAVRVVVPAPELASPTGIGFLEGANAAVPRSTVDRIECDGGFLPIVIDPDGAVVEVGRTQRLYTSRQRVFLSVADGGCRWPGCDKPPAFCEAHHINHWLRDLGRTDTKDGVLLCRHHHLLLHDNDWAIKHAEGSSAARDFVLIPPRSIDPDQKAIPMPSRSLLNKYLHVSTHQKSGPPSLAAAASGPSPRRTAQ